MDTIEQEIQAKGLTAPRVTPADLEAEIEAETYFTAAEGSDNGTGVIGAMDGAREKLAALDRLTFCVLILRNGFTVTGESACASPENFDAKTGQKIARQNAVQKIWPLLGFRLRDRLSAPPPRVLHRDAGTGQLVSAEHAAEHPETTVREVR